MYTGRRGRGGIDPALRNLYPGLGEIPKEAEKRGSRREKYGKPNTGTI
jgi:hypothetical protein